MTHLRSGPEHSCYVHLRYAPFTMLAQGASCAVTVQFTPLTAEAAATKTATLSVADSAGTQSATLTGTAN